MQNRLPAFALVATLFLFTSPSAAAQEAQPGDACTAGQIHHMRQTSGPENPGTGYFLVCDGANWKLISAWDTATGSSLFQVDYDPGACDALKLGRLRFNSAGAALELCDGSAWGGVGGGGSGLWSDSGSGYIYYNSALGGIRIGDVSGHPAPNIIGVTNLNDLGDTAVGTAANGDMLYYNGTNWTVDSGQLYWDATNNHLGIGTGSPQRELHVRNAAGTATARVEGVGGDANLNLFAANNWTLQSLNSDGRLRVWDSTNSVEALTILNSSGFVGIGTASPSRELEIQGSSVSVGLEIENTDAARRWQIGVKDSSEAGNLFIWDGTAGERRLTLTSTGTLALGNDAVLDPGNGAATPIPLNVRKSYTSSTGWDAVTNIQGSFSGSSSTYTGQVGLQVGVTSSITGTGYDESYGIAATVTAANDSDAQNGFAGWFTAETHPNDIMFGLYSGNAVSGASTGGQFRGLHIEATDTDVTNYGVYQNGAAAINYFAGKVGIGTNSPGADLQIGEAGDGDNYKNIVLKTSGGGDGVYQTEIYANYSSPDAGGIKGGDAKLQFSYGGRTELVDYQGLDFKTGGTTTMTIAGNGRVGIGTTGPTRTLEVEGTGDGVIRLKDGNSTGASVIAYTEFYGSDNVRTGYVGDAASTHAHITIRSDGGNISASGNGGQCFVDTGGCSSDLRLKQNIAELDSSLDKLMQIRGIEYEWKKNPGERYYGMIAQEVEKAFPTLVTEEEVLAEDTPDGKPGTYKFVNYNGIVAPLIEAVKELKIEKDREIARLEAQNAFFKTGHDAQQAQIDRLVQEINGLKAHTGYGVSRAEIGIWALAFAFGLSSIFFLIGGILRHRAAKAA